MFSRSSHQIPEGEKMLFEGWKKSCTYALAERINEQVQARREWGSLVEVNPFGSAWLSPFRLCIVVATSCNEL